MNFFFRGIILVHLTIFPLYAENKGNQKAVAKGTPYTLVTDLLKKYKRKVTLLEIGKKQLPWLFSLAKRDTVSVGLLTKGGAQKVVKKIDEQMISNVIVLAPEFVTYNNFKTLSRCEHFDVVIIHDRAINSCSYLELVNVFLQLGDHIFIETTNSYEQDVLKQKKIVPLFSNNGKMLFYSHTKKTGLDIARFTQKNISKSDKPKYTVTSDFSKKLFSKEGLEKPTDWIHGINLVSFVMLGGLFPNDALIRSQIEAFETSHTKHNDLVLGNMIVTGERLIPIDFNDKRRNANLTKCITTALQAFRRGNIRLKNPEKWINEYYRKI